MKTYSHIFLKILLIVLFSSFNSNAEDRIDLDLRLEPKNEKDFYLLKKNFIKKKSIKLGEKSYKITRSENELFVDEYYDTKLFSFSIFRSLLTKVFSLYKLLKRTLKFALAFKGIKLEV